MLIITPNIPHDITIVPTNDEYDSMSSIETFEDQSLGQILIGSNDEQELEIVQV